MEVVVSSIFLFSLHSIASFFFVFLPSAFFMDPLLIIIPTFNIHLTMTPPKNELHIPHPFVFTLAFS
jgi:hypothetical protein